jgi:hypothetical protein
MWAPSKVMIGEQQRSKKRPVLVAPITSRVESSRPVAGVRA